MAASRGMTTRQDALYTNSTLALDPRTGQVRWYFQHAPGETLDLDIVYERVLVDADGEQWLFTIGKDGILWKLDRRTGALVDLRETVYQDVFESIDRTTGELTYRPDIRDVRSTTGVGYGVTGEEGSDPTEDLWSSAPPGVPPSHLRGGVAPLEVFPSGRARPASGTAVIVRSSDPHVAGGTQRWRVRRHRACPLRPMIAGCLRP